MVRSGARGGSKTPLRVFACLVLTLLVVSALPRTLAATQSLMYTFGTPLDDGDSISEYTLYYNIPSVIQAGVPTNLTMYLYITELTGWKYFVNNMQLTFTADVTQEPNAVFTQSFQNNVTAYEGYRWGPFNVTVTFTNAELGLKPGQTTDISFFADLTANEQWIDPYNYRVIAAEASMQMTGNYTVQASATDTNSPVNHHDATAILLGAGIVAVLTIAVLALSSRKKGPAPSAA